MTPSPWLAFLLLVLTGLPPRQAPVTTAAAAPERVADGIELQRLADPALLDSAGPIAIQVLKLDPRKVRLEIAMAANQNPARETVESIATRTHAIAAVNAGFFGLADGKPAAMLKVDGRLLGGTTRARGAVAFRDHRGKTELVFDRVTVQSRQGVYQTRMGTNPKDWKGAPFAVSGAGLLLLRGRTISDWTDEKVSAAFDTTRHPRTVIGEGRGALWLITVDGRQPTLSVGMNFAELQRLAARLGLESALNLDGGGSTTMVVHGRIVNHPSEATGPRPVSDAIVVLPRGR
jgi:exopolysaccharide biosynthesis protein